MAKKEMAQDLVYIQLLGKLRKLINTEYKDGGRFPSSREICDRMGVNRNTYIKALSASLPTVMSTTTAREEFMLPRTGSDVIR